MTKASIIAAAAAILASKSDFPIKLRLTESERKLLRNFSNHQAQKRGKIKAARKQRNRK